MSRYYGLVMAGGKGTRFWPESTIQRPKQFLKLVSPKTILQETLLRFGTLIPDQQRFVVTTEEQRALAIESTNGLSNNSGPIFEPEGRNTAPCILLALAKMLSEGAKKEDLVAIVPSDHVILNIEGFRQTLLKAFETAEKTKGIVTIGIPPHFPHTGFGYIKKGQSITGDDVFKVDQFREKPKLEVALEYVKSGEYFWNAGMFVAPIETLLGHYSKLCPELYQHFASLCNNIKSPRDVIKIYSLMKSISFDYAIMEKCPDVYVARANFDWNDLGSWDAMESVLEQRQANTFVSSNLSYIQNAEGNIISAPGKFVSLIDVKDLVIVCNEKVLMCLPKQSAQKVKDIVDYLNKHPDEKLREDLL